MKLLFDQGVPVPLRHYLVAHEVSTAYELGWSKLENGALLAAAEESGFEMFLTTDQNLQHQQNLDGREIAIAVLTTTSWPTIEANVEAVVASIHAINKGEFVMIRI